MTLKRERTITNTCVAIAFSFEMKAHYGLQARWRLNTDGDLTARVGRDNRGHIRVANRSSGFGTRIAIGVGTGALQSLLANEVGIAAGFARAATFLAVAATSHSELTGGAIGPTADARTEDRRENLADGAFFTHVHSQSTDIGEHCSSVLDDRMHPKVGVVHRPMNTAATNAAFCDRYHGDHMYP